MDKRPIGVFDSGLGGLTAVRKLLELLPNEDIIYFGDTGRVPYGTRSKETIIKYAREVLDYLSDFDLKTIIIACGTVSTTALDILRNSYKIPLYGVVEPSASKAAKLTRNGRIGIIGTNATIQSGANEKHVKKLLQNSRIISKACPLFVPLVENGRFLPGDSVIETVAAEYLEPIKKADVDTLILACTHFPLLGDVIGNYMGNGVTLIDSGASAVEHAAQMLKNSGGLSDNTNSGKRSYYVTDETEGFLKMASLFLRHEIHDSIKKVEF